MRKNDNGLVRAGIMWIKLSEIGCMATYVGHIELLFSFSLNLSVLAARNYAHFSIHFAHCATDTNFHSRAKPIFALITRPTQLGYRFTGSANKCRQVYLLFVPTLAG